MSTAAASSPQVEAQPPKQPSRVVPALVTLVALLLGLISAFLAWFVFSGSSVTLLPDSYNSMIVYGTQGSSALASSNALGAALYASSTSDPVLLVAFAIVLFFWPAMLVSGTYNALARSFAPYPFIWGLIAFIFAYILNYKAPATNGIGVWLVLVASIIFLVASILGRFVQPKAMPVVAVVGTTAAGSSTATATPPPSSP
jgi:hypothetical protein